MFHVINGVKLSEPNVNMNVFFLSTVSINAAEWYSVCLCY